MRYKLIKTYPGYDTIGLIVNTDDVIYSESYFTQYPEYWQLVKDKKIHIVTIKKSTSDNSWYVDKIGHTYMVVYHSELYFMLIESRLCTERTEILNDFVKSSNMIRITDTEIIATFDV